jgi:hypothetical protein
MIIVTTVVETEILPVELPSTHALSIRILCVLVAMGAGTNFEPTREMAEEVLGYGLPASGLPTEACAEVREGNTLYPVQGHFIANGRSAAGDEAVNEVLAELKALRAGYSSI